MLWKFHENFFGGVEKSNVSNRLKRVLAKFRADPSHVRAARKNYYFVVALNQLIQKRPIDVDVAVDIDIDVVVDVDADVDAL